MDNRRFCNWLPISDDEDIAVVIDPISTSNHNAASAIDAEIKVVIHSISTSNHNQLNGVIEQPML